MQRQQNWIATGLALYAFLSLISMAAMSIGAGLAVLSMGIAFGPTEYARRVREAASQGAGKVFFFLSLGLALACLISLIAAWIWPLGYGGKFVEIHLGKDMAKAWYLFWPLLLLPGLQALDERRRSRVLLTWLGTFALLSVLAVVQYYTGFPKKQLIPSGTWNRYHATLFLGHHLSVASIFIFPFFASLDLARGLKDARLKILAALLAILGAIALFLTFSRAAWLAVPIGLLLWLAWALKPRYALAALAMMAGAAAMFWKHPQIYYRIKETGFASSTRTELWKVNWMFFQERPLTGTGWHHNLELGGYYYHSIHPDGQFFGGHAHNNFLEMIASTGLLGALTWIAWCIGFVWLAWPLARRGGAAGPQFARGLICAWLVFQLSGLTQVNFWESKVLHQIMWVTAWLLLWRSQQDSRPAARLT